jgi:hypothetical protein
MTVLVPGLNAHGLGTGAYANTVYARNPQGVIEAAKNLNVKSIRDNTVNGIKQWREAGFEEVYGPGVSYADVLAKLRAGATIAEPPNEWFTNTRLKNPDGSTMTQAQRASGMKSLVGDTVRARDDYFKESGRWVPVMGPSISMGNRVDALAVAKLIGPLPGVDFGNLHCYSGNRSEADFKSSLLYGVNICDAMTPGKPIYLSEFGMWWDEDPVIRADTTHFPTAPADAIRLIPVYFKVIEDTGRFVTVNWYETADEERLVNGQLVLKGSDANNDWQEGRLGLLTKDLKDKAWTPTVRAEYLKRITPPPPPPPVDPPAPVDTAEVAAAKQLQTKVGATVDGVPGPETVRLTNEFIATLEARYTTAKTSVDAANQALLDKAQDIARLDAANQGLVEKLRQINVMSELPPPTT